MVTMQSTPHPSIFWERQQYSPLRPTRLLLARHVEQGGMAKAASFFFFSPHPSRKYFL